MRVCGVLCVRERGGGIGRGKSIINTTSLRINDVEEDKRKDSRKMKKKKGIYV